MKRNNPFLTVDSNVVIAALRGIEPSSRKCGEILAKASEHFVLAEPSIIYQEVCGTLSRKASLDTANKAIKHLDYAIEPKWLTSCDRTTCVSAFALCGKYKIYAVDALYLYVALANNAILVSLDKEFIDKLNGNSLHLEAYTVDNFPY